MICETAKMTEFGNDVSEFCIPNAVIFAVL